MDTEIVGATKDVLDRRTGSRRARAEFEALLEGIERLFAVGRVGYAAPRRITDADCSEILHGIRKRHLSHQGTSPPAGYTTATDWAVPKNTRDERVHTPQSGRSFRGAIGQYSDRLVGVSGWNPIGSWPLPSHDTVMIADPFIQGRVTSKTKALVRALRRAPHAGPPFDALIGLTALHITAILMHMR